MQLKLTLAVIASAITFLSYGQGKQDVCNDPKVHSELVSIDNSWEQQGFQLVQYQSFNMKSGGIYPVYISMEQGKMYQLNFVASEGYQQYTFALIDKDKKKLIEQKVKSKENKHHLTLSFAAPYTGNYVFVLSQKVKDKDVACGGFSVLKAVNDHLPAGK